jgi:hypothetical protein
MPVIKLEFDDSIVNTDTTKEFCEAIRRIVVDSTGLPENEICLYGNNSQIKINVAPIQVWLEISDYKVSDVDKLANDIRDQIVEWKDKTKFAHQIKFMLVPKNQKIVEPI